MGSVVNGKYRDSYWVTITIDRHSKNVQRFFKNKNTEQRFYTKYPRGGKLEKIVIGCADWVEGSHIEANFENHVEKYDGLVIRKSGSMSKPRIDKRKYKVTELSRNQAEKQFPSLFKKPNADLLKKAIKDEEIRRSPYVSNPDYVPLPPHIVKKAKQIVSKM